MGVEAGAGRTARPGVPGDPGEDHWAGPVHRRLALHLRARRGLNPYTVRNYLTDLAPFWRFLDDRGVRDLSAVERPLLRQYLHWLLTDAPPMAGGRATPRDHPEGKQATGYAARSVARKLSALRCLFGFLAKEGDVPGDPTSLVSSARAGRRLPDFLDADQAVSLVESPDGATPIGLRDRAILETLYAAGLRVSELTGLDVGDLDLEAAQARVVGKGSRQRLALLGGPALDALRLYLRSGRPRLVGRRDPGALFLNRDGGRLSQRGVQKLVRGHALRAGLESPVHPHTIRHTFATHMLDGGADLRVVQELLGHATPATTQIYTHVTQASARRTYVAAHPRARRGGSGGAEWEGTPQP